MQFWDDLRAATNRWDIVETFPWGDVEFPGPGPVRDLGMGIQETTFDGPLREMNRDAFRDWMRGLRGVGWELVQCEFRHRRFEPAADGGGQSVFSVTLHARRESPPERAAVTAEVGVVWETGLIGGVPAYVPRILRIGDGVVRRRPESGMFVRQLSRPVTPDAGLPFIDPLIVEDWDGNGFPEIILGCKNEVYRNRGGGRFERGRWLPAAGSSGLASVLCDLTGDGLWDWLIADHDGISVWAGGKDGKWSGTPRRVWRSETRLENPFVLAPGDVDGDGDMDLWLGQYKVPYVGGQMPTPYHDARDGFPGYLLLQTEGGLFTDGTEAAGLAGKRHRRTYSAVLADLDGDRDVDLSLVSDFAGLDIFWNRGNGVFDERVVASSRSLGDGGASMESRTRDGQPVFGNVLEGSTRAFGMAQALGDFSGDGRLDLLMIGMNSFTGQRLAGLGLGTQGDAAKARARQEMSHGNRLFLGVGNGLSETACARELRETGWSWGVTTADFDNDGWLDVYIVNGHKSRGTVRDYDRQFWMHDIEVGRSETDSVRELYFQATAGRLYGAGWSYGGFEKNRLLRGQGGGRFEECAWLLDVAFEDDFRNVVSADFDRDGRMDFVGTTYGNWPEGRQGLHIVRNEIVTPNHWVGFVLRNGGRGKWTQGARVSVSCSEKVQHRWLVAGDSYRSQHPAMAHFGLGPETQVAWVEVLWPDGTVQKLERPEVDRYHDIPR